MGVESVVYDKCLQKKKIKVGSLQVTCHAIISMEFSEYWAVSAVTSSVFYA